MKHTEFWGRLEHALGPVYARTWAHDFVMSDLGQRTAQEALAAGVPPREVWAAVCQVLELPANER